MEKPIFISSMHSSEHVITGPRIDIYKLMNFAFGLTQLDVDIYQILLLKGLLDLKEIASEVDASIGGTRMGLKKLVEKNLVCIENDFIGLGGYKHLYYPIPPTPYIREFATVALEKFSKAIKESIDVDLDKLQEYYESNPTFSSQ
jgi:predicted transcriptional regulator